MTQAQRTIPFLDFRAQYAAIRAEVLDAVMRVLDSQRFVLGEEVEMLEKELGDYCGARAAVGCGSGSDALLLALMACGIGPGDAVLTTPFTFFATAGTIARLHATPVFADIERQTMNINPERVCEALAGRPRVKAILPVHLFGAAADMDPILDAAARYGCAVIEDAAQAIGAEYKNRRVGSLGDFGCFSFYPTKNLGGYGEGGLVTTNDAAVARRLAALRVHGSHRRYYHEEIGLNSRLDALQASVLRVKFRHLDAWTAARQRNAALYREHLAGAPVILPVALPWQTRHVWNQFVIRAEKRDELRDCLKGQGIGTEIYYPLSLHEQPCFQSLGYKKGAFPESEAAAATALALPVGPERSADDIVFVCQQIRGFYGAS